ncbi:hypothetical protein [Hyalangium rubrum]|uniref:Uncharacterized protein n=1 Tax=Hyalangium rubrum TaxID=3103134 RepID=A0ABU5H5E7_9BACT|nr:hypothetical protein [Hyalangium sp. s54d21]MDY7228555.1 hypothetical protein [Hyalangium sp. s54d21]
MIRRVDGGSSPAVERFSKPEPKPVETKQARSTVDLSRDTFAKAEGTGGAAGAGAAASPGAVGAAAGAAAAAGATSATSAKLREEFQASDGFKDLSADQQKQALEVFDAMDLQGQRALKDLTDRQMSVSTETDCRIGTALLDRDSTGKTLLDNLHQMATQKMPDSFKDSGVTRESLMASICQEAAHPGEINQHNRGTCTVTSMQYMLNDTNPAEYARIMTGLMSEKGEVTLASGATLSRDADSIAPDSATQRSSSERLFQAAMMQYARGGAEGDYSNLTNKDDGLNASEQERTLEALFNRDFDNYTGGGADDILAKLKDRSPTDSYIRMHWGEDKSGGHAVVVDRVENGRVYIRNPHGPGGTQGDTLENPPRVVEDPATGLQSMSEADFKEWIKSTII